MTTSCEAGVSSYTTIWDMLPLKEMLAHRTCNERTFIDPDERCISGDGVSHELTFHANANLSLLLSVTVERGLGLIVCSSFRVYRGTGHKVQYAAFRRVEGEEAWVRYCLVLYCMLYTDFML